MQWEALQFHLDRQLHEILQIIVYSANTLNYNSNTPSTQIFSLFHEIIHQEIVGLAKIKNATIHLYE